MKRTSVLLISVLLLATGCASVATQQRRATVRIEAKPSEPSAAALRELRTLVMQDRFIRNVVVNPTDGGLSQNLISAYAEALKIGASHRESKGSGFLIRLEQTGEILAITNKHVVETAPKVNVFLEDQLSINNCDVRYVDEKIDIAVISIPKLDTISNVEIVALSNSDASDNARVEATGYPSADNKEQSYRITQGNISNATFKLAERGEGTFLQHTAPIDPGSSGGPLFSAGSTEVAGVNMFVGLLNRSLYAAIPASAVKSVIAKAIARPAKGILGTEPLLVQACKRLFQEINANGDTDDSTIELMSEVTAMATLAQDLRNQIQINSLLLLDEKPVHGPVVQGAGGRKKIQLPTVMSALVGLSTGNDDALITRAKLRMFEIIRQWVNKRGGPKEEWCREYVEEDFKNYEQDHRIRISLPIEDSGRRVISWRFEQGHWRVIGFE